MKTNNNSYIMTWDDLIKRVQYLQDDIYTYLGEFNRLKIYGVPRGGLMLASVFTTLGWNELVFDPNKADIIIDDIIDSGATKKYYTEKYNKPFFALIDKQNNEEHKELGWLVFPWESSKPDTLNDNLLRVLQFYNLPDSYLPALNDNIELFIKNLDY